MRFGFSAGCDKAAYMGACGYDFQESYLDALYGMTEEELEAQRRTMREAGLTLEAFNCFFPGDMTLVGEKAVPPETIRAFARKVLQRAAGLGGRIAVLGSGGARRVPEGVPMEAALEQFADAARIVGDEAARAGMTVVLEPLSRHDTNLLNTVEETAAFCRRLNHPAVFLLADLFHMHENSENFDVLAESGGLLRHVHMCNPIGRHGMSRQDAYDYTPFVRALARAGYRGRITIEADVRDYAAEIKDSLEALRALWPAED